MYIRYQVNVPCPPNPARLKRAAKLKAQKEAALAKKEKMKRMEALGMFF